MSEPTAPPSSEDPVGTGAAAAAAQRPAGPFGLAYRATTASLVALISVVAFEFMAISTAMPAAAATLDAVGSYGAAFTTMLIGQLVGIVLAGTWCDDRGPMAPITVGQVLFAAGAATCATSVTFPVFLLGRALTGLGAGLVVVAAFVVIGGVYPETVRPRVFAWISAAWVLPSMLGAPLAGWLTRAFSWRLVFWVVVLPTACTMVALWRQRARIAAGRPAGNGTESSARAVHVRAARLGMLIAAAAAVLQVGANALGDTPRWAVAAVIAGAVGIGLTFPKVVPAGTLRLRRGLPSVMATRLLLNGTFSGALTYVPLMLTNRFGLDERIIGGLLASGSLGWTLGSYLQGQARFEGRRPSLVTAGATALTAGIGTIAAVGWAGATWPWLVPGIVLGGLGMGLASTTLSVLSLSYASAREHGEASSSLQLSDVLGSTLGITLGSALFAVLHPVHGHSAMVYGAVWTAMTAMAALSIVSARRCRRH